MIVVAKITQSKVVHQYGRPEMVWRHVKTIYTAYGQGNGKTVVPYSPSLLLKTLYTGILLLGVFTLDLEMDHPSETSLCTVARSPQTPLLRFFSEGRGRLYTGYLERIILSSKVRRIAYSKLKLFHCQIKTYHVSDANHQTDNPSHTNNPSLMRKRPFLL